LFRLSCAEFWKLLSQFIRSRLKVEFNFASYGFAGLLYNLFILLDEASFADV